MSQFNDSRVTIFFRRVTPQNSSQSHTHIYSHTQIMIKTHTYTKIVDYITQSQKSTAVVKQNNTLDV